jgi:hypothetical protein
MGTRDLFGVMDMFNWTGVMVAQFIKFISNTELSSSDGRNLTVCKLYLNKDIFRKLNKRSKIN